VNCEDLLPLAVFGAVAFGVWLVADLLAGNSGPVVPVIRTPRVVSPFAVFGVVGVGLFLLANIGAWPAHAPVVLPVAPIITPRSLFEETRMGVTRDDVRCHLRNMENNVPSVLHDMESNVPDVMHRMESEMMSNAYKYGLSSSDVRAQLQEIEWQSRQQIRNMEPEVRQNIRSMEEPVWEDLRRLERGY
jgi:hypothetical protein